MLDHHEDDHSGRQRDREDLMRDEIEHFCACARGLPAPQFGQPVVSNGRAGTGFERARIDVRSGKLSMPARALDTACKPATLGPLPGTKNSKHPPAKRK